MHWLLRRMKHRVLRSPPVMLRVFVLSIVVLAYGATGFLFFEKPSNPELEWNEAIWYAFVTVTTVGYGDFSPATIGGRYLIAIPLMFFGIGLLGYILSLAASALIEARSKEIKGMAKINLIDHLLICNYPNLNTIQRIIKELAADGSFRDRDIVIVDDELEELPAPLHGLKDPEVHFVRGNPSCQETLDQANVMYARDALILSKSEDAMSDARNVVITLAIEDCNSTIRTVTQCVDPSTKEVLKRAHCDGIVCTTQFDVLFLSQEILDPGASSVVAELTSNLKGQQIYVTEWKSQNTSFVNVANGCLNRGHLAIGVRRLGENQLNPPNDFMVRKTDEIITIGPKRLYF